MTYYWDVWLFPVVFALSASLGWTLIRAVGSKENEQTSRVMASSQSVKPIPDCKVGKTATHLSQIVRYPTEHSCNHCILTSREGHMGCRTAEACDSITARCACEVTQESQSVLLLLHKASVGLDRWEWERCHLVMPWHGGRQGNLCVIR